MTTFNTRTCRRENATTQSPPAETPLFLCSSSPGIDCPEPVLAKTIAFQKETVRWKRRFRTAHALQVSHSLPGNDKWRQPPVLDHLQAVAGSGAQPR